MKLVFIVIIIFIVILLVYSEITLNYNKNKHLTDSYSYAHFSNINSYNYFLNYDFIFRTSPIYIELNEGESLYIPSKMWHWIITEDSGFSVNFWFEKDPNKEIKHDNYKLEPIFNKIYNNMILQDFNNYIKQNKQKIWNSYDNSSLSISGNEFLNSKEKNRALITLDGYDFDDNFQIKNYLKKKIGIPIFIENIIKKKSYYDVNLWYVPTSHDTGLHYDDYDGILHLIKGKKKIYLYPQSDSIYLNPYNIIPNYALTKPIYMNYNEYIIYESNNIKGKSSQFLLYKTLEYFAINKNIHKIIQKIYDIKLKNKYLIWGFKKKDDEYRWEIYIYHFKPSKFEDKCKENIFIKNIINNNIPNKDLVNELINNPNIIINSFDILNNNNIFNDEIHTYEKVLYDNQLPFWGSGYDIINLKKTQVGNFIYDDTQNFLKNAEYYLKKLGLPSNSDVIKLLHKYDCKNMCLWNKNNDLFIQWLVISIDDFINFLQENNYKEDFVNFILSNKNEFTYISHEITIVYNKDTLIPIRSGFYGCL